MRISIFLIFAYLLSSCQYKVKSEGGNSVSEDSTMAILTGVDSANMNIDDYQYFSECGFAVKAPCLLEDVSQQSSGNFFINYAGFTDKENPDRITFYQVMVIRLPIGYKDLSKCELSSLVDGLMKKGIDEFSNSKSIRFSYDEYPGYAIECTTEGYAQKGVIFWKDNFIICLTVITNDGLNEKFNKFTNSFKSIKSSFNSVKADVEIVKPSVNLEKQYSNKYFQIKYPSSWQIVQDDNQVTNNTSISVQIMEIQKNEYDFRPNINIIVSEKKWNVPTSFLAKQTISQSRKLIDNYQLISQRDDVILNRCKGTTIEYTVNIQGYALHGLQYIIKKSDNTTFTITGTMDASNYEKQKIIIDEIINSLIIE